MVQENAEENITIAFFQNYSKESFEDIFLEESYFHHNDALFTIKAINCFGLNCSFIPVK